MCALRLQVAGSGRSDIGRTSGKTDARGQPKFMSALADMPELGSVGSRSGAFFNLFNQSSNRAGRYKPSRHRLAAP